MNNPAGLGSGDLIEPRRASEAGRASDPARKPSWRPSESAGIPRGEGEDGWEVEWTDGNLNWSTDR